MKELLEEIKQIKKLLYEFKMMFTRCVSGDKLTICNKDETKNYARDKLIINKENTKNYVDMEKLRFISGKYVRQLTYNEAVILNELLTSKDNFCSYDYLCNILYGCKTDDYAQHSIRTCISRIRRKTEGLIEIKSAKKKGFYIKYIDYED